MKTENLAILGFSILVVYYFFMRNEKPSESSYLARVGAWGGSPRKLSSGEDPCCNPPKCYRSGCMGAPCCDSATSMAPTKNYNSSKRNTSAYQEIPSPNYNLTDEPLRLAQITFGY
jgi:hypothetical protein